LYGEDQPTGITVDSAGDVYVAGLTYAPGIAGGGTWTIRKGVGGTSFSTALESFIGQQADELMAALKNGKMVSYEWMDWPARKSRHGTASLSGFREAAEQCERDLS
jgi:hypothetical protein